MMKIFNKTTAFIGITGATVAIGAAQLVTPKVPVLELSEVEIVEIIKSEQENYFNEKGKYLQIEKGGRKLDNSIKQFQDTSFLNAGTSIIEYVSPKGAGYQILYEIPSEVHSYGFGPEADSRTWIRTKFEQATST